MSGKWRFRHPENEAMDDFIDLCLLKKKDGKVKVQELFKAYKNFHLKTINHRSMLSVIGFGILLRKRVKQPQKIVRWGKKAYSTISGYELR